MNELAHFFSPIQIDKVTDLPRIPVGALPRGCVNPEISGGLQRGAGPVLEGNRFLLTER